MRVFKRGKVYWIDYFANGQRIRESTGTASKKRALQLLHKRQAAVFAGRFDFQEVKQSPRFSDFADYYLESFSKVNKSKSMYTREQTAVRSLRPFLGKYQLNAITPMLIEHFKRKRLKDGRKPATVNRELDCLRQIYRLAVRDRRVIGNPAREVKKLPEDNEIANAITDQDEELLLAHAAPHLRDLIICAVDTGMRRSDIFDLRWSNVDIPNRVIVIKQQKTKRHKANKTVEIPISARLLGVLRRLEKESKSEYVFLSPRTGEKLTKIDTAWRRANERAGLQHKRYRFHDTRGTFITRLFEEGLNEITIKQLSGHSTTRMLERYARPGGEWRRAAIDALDRRRARKTPVDIRERRR